MVAYSTTPTTGRAFKHFMANPAGPFGHWNVKRPAFVCCVGRLRVDCRHQTTKAQWPLQNHKRPARTVAAEAESQRPDLTESSRSDSSGHWQRSTLSGSSSNWKAAVQRWSSADGCEWREAPLADGPLERLVRRLTCLRPISIYFVFDWMNSRIFSPH